MLADFGRDVEVAVLDGGVEALQRILWLDDRIGGLRTQAVPRPPLIDLLPPAIERLHIRPRRTPLPFGDQRLQDGSRIADDAEVNPNILVNGRRVDIDMDLLRPRREGADLAR